MVSYGAMLDACARAAQYDMGAVRRAEDMLDRMLRRWRTGRVDGVVD